MAIWNLQVAAGARPRLAYERRRKNLGCRRSKSHAGKQPSSLIRSRGIGTDAGYGKGIGKLLARTGK